MKHIYTLCPKMEIRSNVKWYIWVLREFLQGGAESKYEEEEIVVCL
jgi:hypothetical protein